jgi:RNA polymerase sigma-70 factor (ECF subfamily)
LAADERRRRFELLALPHLDAAFGLARWLAGNADDADDVAQEAYLRAFRHFDTFRGDDMRVWLLAIVRNSFVTWAGRNRSARLQFAAETVEHDAPIWGEAPADPETLLLRRADSATIERLLAALPAEYREVLVLREIEELSYRQIAQVIAAPEGTVMSRLARARARLRRLWDEADQAT